MYVGYGLCTPNHQINSRDNLLELGRIWSHHYLEQKCLAVLSTHPDYRGFSLPSFHKSLFAYTLWISCCKVLAEMPVSFFFFIPNIWSCVDTFFPLKPIFLFSASWREGLDEVGLKTLGWDSYSGLTRQKKLLSPGSWHAFSFDKMSNILRQE